MLKAMPVSYEFLRGVLGVIGLACAYMSGRSLLAVRKGWQKLSRLYGWILRAAACLGAMVLRHPLDTMTMIVWAVAVVAFAAGYWQALHQKPPEDLTEQIFPHES
jgi:hypothetical protein